MFFVHISKRGRGSLCPGLKKACSSIRGEDMYVRLRQLWVFITRENASLASFASLNYKNDSNYKASELIPSLYVLKEL